MRASTNLDYLQYAYRPDLRVLVGRWMRCVTTQELQTGYQALLTVAEKQACSFWLLDSRRRVSVSLADIQWMMEEFYPQLFQELHTTSYLAFLLAPSQLTEVVTDPRVPALTYFDGLPYQIGRFIDERLAVEWLQYQQQARGAL